MIGLTWPWPDQGDVTLHWIIISKNQKILKSEIKELFNKIIHLLIHSVLHGLSARSLSGDRPVTDLWPQNPLHAAVLCIFLLKPWGGGVSEIGGVGYWRTTLSKWQLDGHQNKMAAHTPLFFSFVRWEWKCGGRLCLGQWFKPQFIHPFIVANQDEMTSIALTTFRGHSPRHWFRYVDDIWVTIRGKWKLSLTTSTRWMKTPSSQEKMWGTTACSRLCCAHWEKWGTQPGDVQKTYPHRPLPSVRLTSSTRTQTRAIRSLKHRVQDIL